jgi:hypothetical protein
VTTEAKIAAGIVLLAVAVAAFALWAGGPVLEFTMPRCWECA